jgi:hypothetical protein
MYLADVKKKREEYMAQKNSAAATAPSAFGVPTPTAPVAAGKFSF